MNHLILYVFLLLGTIGFGISNNRQVALEAEKKQVLKELKATNVVLKKELKKLKNFNRQRTLRDFQEAGEISWDAQVLETDKEMLEE